MPPDEHWGATALCVFPRQDVCALIPCVEESEWASERERVGDFWSGRGFRQTCECVSLFVCLWEKGRFGDAVVAWQMLCWTQGAAKVSRAKPQSTCRALFNFNDNHPVESAAAGKMFYSCTFEATDGHSSSASPIAEARASVARSLHI